MLLGEHDTRGDAHIISFKCKSCPCRKVSTDQTGPLLSHDCTHAEKQRLDGEVKKTPRTRGLSTSMWIFWKINVWFQQLRDFNLPVRVWLCIISKQNDSHCVLIPAVIPLWNWLLQAIFFNVCVDGDLFGPVCLPFSLQCLSSGVGCWTLAASRWGKKNRFCKEKGFFFCSINTFKTGQGFVFWRSASLLRIHFNTWHR